MPIPLKNKSPFQFGSFYHIYNRSVDGQLLFYSQSGYKRFLHKYQAYFSDLLNLYSYALIPNHFHLVASVKDEKDCKLSVKEIKHLNSGIWQIDDVVRNRFKNFFLSHSLSNKNRYSVKTNVFAQKFKHILIDRDNYFSSLIAYIHLNPVKHRQTKDYINYQWSSYKGLLLSDSLLKFKYVFDWFGGKDEFIRFHESQFEEYEYKYWSEYEDL